MRVRVSAAMLWVPDLVVPDPYLVLQQCGFVRTLPLPHRLDAGQTVGCVLAVATAIVTCATFVRRSNQVPWLGVAALGTLAGAVLMLASAAVWLANAFLLRLVRVSPTLPRACVFRTVCAS